MKVNQIDAAVLTEELAEIYSTPTPKGVAGAEKANDLYIGLIVVLYNSRGLVFIPRV